MLNANHTTQTLRSCTAADGAQSVNDGTRNTVSPLYGLIHNCFLDVGSQLGAKDGIVFQIQMGIKHIEQLTTKFEALKRLNQSVSKVAHVEVEIN